MENNTNSLEVLLEKTGDYLETRIELLKLSTVSTTSEVTSSLLSKFVIALVLSLLILILNIGIAIWIGDEMGKMYYGFFIVSGFYLIVAIVLYYCRNSWIKKPLHDMLIKKMLN